MKERSRKNTMHETQPMEAPQPVQNDGYVDPLLQQMQTIEGGGPMKKVVFADLPKPIRYLSFILLGLILVLVAAVFLSDWLT